MPTQAGEKNPEAVDVTTADKPLYDWMIRFFMIPILFNSIEQIDVETFFVQRFV